MISQLEFYFKPWSNKESNFYISIPPIAGTKKVNDCFLCYLQFDYINLRIALGYAGEAGSYITWSNEIISSLTHEMTL